MTQLHCIRAHPCCAARRLGTLPYSVCARPSRSGTIPMLPPSAGTGALPGAFFTQEHSLKSYPLQAQASPFNGKHRTLKSCRESNNNYVKKMHKHNLKECIKYHLSLFFFGSWNYGGFFKFSMFSQIFKNDYFYNLKTKILKEVNQHLQVF